MDMSAAFNLCDKIVLVPKLRQLGLGSLSSDMVLELIRKNAQLELVTKLMTLYKTYNACIRKGITDEWMDGQQ